MNSNQIYTLLILLGFFKLYYTQNDTVGYQYKLKIGTSVSVKEMKKQFIIEQSIENIAENNEDEEIDYTTLFDQLSYYYEHPINLNKKEIEYDLNELQLLNQFQIQSIINHKKKHGKLITLYELQTISLIEPSDLRKIIPFITVNTNLDATQLSFSEMINRGDNDLFLRFSRVLNNVSGQRNVNDSIWVNSPSSVQLGSPDNLYLRYRFKYQNHLSIGLTTEKDAGEAFLVNNRAHQLFNKSNKIGFDFYSAHFYIRDVGKINALALGDYHIQLGQGLTFWSGLAIGKSSDVMGTKRNPSGIKPYTAIDENRFLRGAAIKMNYKKFNFLAFGSKKKLDANLKEDTALNEGTIVVSSFQNSGLHSTISELDNKDALEETIIGGEITYENDFFTIGFINTLTNYSGLIDRNLSIYNQFQLNTNTNWLSGIHYSIVKRNLNLFGETSRSLNGGIANLHGLLASLHPKVALSILHRNYDQDFQSSYSNAIAENSMPNNENGLLAGLQIKLNNHWEISSYFDQFQFPWMKYQVSKPNSIGMDGFFQISYHPSKVLNIYGRIRHRLKPYNQTISSLRDINSLENVVRENYRINFNVLITESIRLRNRVEYCTYQRHGNQKEEGVLIIQDIMYKPKESKFSFSTRFAVFDTDSYNSRIYSYENDVLYYFRIPAYYYQGIRSYITIKYRIKKGIDFWIRASNWSYNNRKTVGSGYNEIENNSKTDLRAQLRIQF